MKEINIPQELRGLHQSKEAFSQLQELGTFWVGQDISINKKEIIYPRGVTDEVSIILNKDNLPPVDINRSSLNLLNWSVRSFLAQSGIEPVFSQHTLSDKDIEDLKNGKNISVPILLINYGLRSVEVDGALMRFFWADDSKRMRGGELRSVIGNDLVIEGEEGKDWQVGNADLDQDMEYLKTEYQGSLEDLCIKLPLNDKKFYIPSNSEPVSIKSRKDLPSVLEEIPEGLNLDFKIGETTKVKLSENIIAVINTGAYDKGGRHIRSPLIDSGFEGNIRTEIVDNLNYIELFIYKK